MGIGIGIDLGTTNTAVAARFSSRFVIPVISLPGRASSPPAKTKAARAGMPMELASSDPMNNICPCSPAEINTMPKTVNVNTVMTSRAEPCPISAGFKTKKNGTK